MHFRTRGKVVQVIRTTYDADTKRAKTQLLGSIKKGAPEIDDELRLSCTPEEYEEAQAWVQNEITARRIEHELAARTLIDQIDKALHWLDTSAKTPETIALATNLLGQVPMMRMKLQKFLS